MPIPSVEDPVVSTVDQPGQAHEAILQLLNRQVGDTFFSAEAFEPTVSDWNNVPVVYFDEHPDLAAFETNPDTELQRLSETYGKPAKLAGRVSNARIETTGHPRLMGDLVLNADPEVFQLIEAGKLSLSTGFWGQTADDGTLKGSVVPNHVLIFEETALNQPRDRGAIILNKQERGTMKAFTSAGRVMSGANQSEFQKLIDGLKGLFDKMTGTSAETKPEETEPEPEPEPVTNMDENTIASKDAEIAGLKEMLQKEQTEREALANKVAEIEAASKEAAWQSLKNKLPPGLVHKPEDEKATRDLFESDPFAFTNKLLEIRAEAPKREEGQPFTNTEDKESPLAISRELRQSTGRMR